MVEKIRKGSYNKSRKEGTAMEREGLYLLTVVNILLGFRLLYRGGGRFGFQTYRSFLDREERRRRKK